MRKPVEKAVGLALTLALAVEVGPGVAVGLWFGW